MSDGRLDLPSANDVDKVKKCYCMADALKATNLKISKKKVIQSTYFQCVHLISFLVEIIT